MTEIIHNYPAGKDGTIIFGPWEDAEVNNHMAYYIENIKSAFTGELCLCLEN